MTLALDENVQNLLTCIERQGKVRLPKPSQEGWQKLAPLFEGITAHLACGDRDSAGRALREALAICPSSFRVRSLLADLHWRSNEVAESIREQMLAQITAWSATLGENVAFEGALNRVRPFTLLANDRLCSLYLLARQICLDDIPGNFVECGTCRGGSAALLAWVIQKYSVRPRTLFACDTFEGMPPPREMDRHRGVHANNGPYGVGTLKAPVDANLKVVCAMMNVSSIVRPVKGLFKDTLPAMREEMGEVAFLHADGDWYDSTMDIFNNLYASVVADGAVQIDDWGHWEGCSKAVNDFQAAHALTWPLRRIDDTGAWFRRLRPDSSLQEILSTLYSLRQAARRNGEAAVVERLNKALVRLVPQSILSDPIA